MKDSGSKFILKITLVGDGRVGKTTLIRNFTKGEFVEDYIKTIGAQFTVYDKIVNDDKVRLMFWDIAGQDDFSFARPSFFKNSNAAIIVYSLEENDLGYESFKHIPNWHADIKQFCGDIPVVVLANKVDLVDENEIDKSKIQDIVKNHNFLGYYITSAKTGQGVVEAFNTIIDDIYYTLKAISS
ncbi:MAG: Rab family GTPase [Candidatus Thorarchaeota archaeon]